ncbi:hypothetical protein, partial [Atlantibacter hermannii]|uniref:hypothetical protein n=1 Tax=Atlantibacter hermannii TaxID=565 RepID=UPI0020748131
IRCPRQNMKTSIINGSEVSKLSVAIHTPKIKHLSSKYLGELPATLENQTPKPLAGLRSFSNYLLYD